MANRPIASGIRQGPDVESSMVPEGSRAAGPIDRSASGSLREPGPGATIPSRPSPQNARKTERRMFVRPCWKPWDVEAAYDLIGAHPWALLVQNGDDGPLATNLPLYLVRGRGPRGTLVGHMARMNDHSRVLAEVADARARRLRGAAELRHGELVSEPRHAGDLVLHGGPLLRLRPDPDAGRARGVAPRADRPHGGTGPERLEDGRGSPLRDHAAPAVDRRVRARRSTASRRSSSSGRTSR